MGSDFAISLVKETLLTGALIAAPVILVALVVGIVVSILQVVTQIQDSTLTFIPKIVAVAVVLALCGSWMLAKLLHFTETLIANIPNYLQ